MRESKFRGKGIESGEWFYGQFVDDYDSSSAYGYIVNGVIESNEEYIAIEEWFPVKKETVGQFTGLLDKNGKEIYEGDVLFDTVTDNFATVEVLNGNFYVNWGDWPDWSWEEMACDHLDRLEIIGNRYENPELLEGAK